MSLPALELKSPLSAAYDHCEALTRRASSNFYWGFRLLPHDRRRALCAVYAFCRAADDIADEPGAARDPERLLARWRAELEAVYAGRPRHPIGVALAGSRAQARSCSSHAARRSSRSSTAVRPSSARSSAPRAKA